MAPFLFANSLLLPQWGSSIRQGGDQAGIMPSAARVSLLPGPLRKETR